MLTFVATDLQLYKIFKTVQVPFLGHSIVHCRHNKSKHYIISRISNITKEQYYDGRYTTDYWTSNT